VFFADTCALPASGVVTVRESPVGEAARYGSSSAPWYRLISAKTTALLLFVISIAACGGASTGPVAPRAVASAAAPSASGNDAPSSAAPVADVPCDDAPAPALAAETKPADSAHAGANADDADDGFEPPPPTGGDSSAEATQPIDALTDDELEAKLRVDASSLGSMSLGGIHSGTLLFGVQMPPGPEWVIQSPPRAWGTREMVLALTNSIDKVNAQFPGTPPLYIGDLGAKNGGFLPPHVSHQGGRDVDISYYLESGHRWYATANAQNLDRARTWALVRTLMIESDVEMILMDTSVQKILKQYATEIGEDKAWLDDVFQVGGKSARPIFFHVPGHASHIHVRFWAPASRELGRRAYAFLMKRHLIKPPTYFIEHVVKPGETLGAIAARYRLSVDALKRANHLTSNVIVRGRAYKIPRTGGIERASAKLIVPARRVPPPRAEALAPKLETSAPRPCAKAAASSHFAPAAPLAPAAPPAPRASLQQRTPVE
jgi:murein endopeptidase